MRVQQQVLETLTELIKVALATMSQTSTCGQTGGPGSQLNKYSDYTSVTPAPILERGVGYLLEVKAGTTGSMTVCKNQPFSLFQGLTGIVNMGRQWLDYNLVPMSSSVVGHTTLKNPGVYSFRYTISNGVCPQDTSYVIVTVSNQCDFLNLDDVFVDEFKVFPVPTSNELNIQINEQLIGGSVKILDARGRLIVELPALKDHQTQINLQEFESGIYFLRLEHEGRTLLRKISKQ